MTFSPALLKRWLHEIFAGIIANLGKNHLWQRVLKNTICTTTTLIIGVAPNVLTVYGHATFLGSMVTVFGHPGRRFGQVAEALILILLGTFAGFAWSLLGLYLSSLVFHSNVDAAYAIRAVFFALTVILHGLLRSSTPRLFLFVFLMVIVSLTILTSTATAVSKQTFTQIAYPILTAVAVVITVNISIFPEFSNDFLGKTTIETLCETVQCFRDAGDWFLSTSTEINSDTGVKTISTDLRAKLVSLTDKKAKVRSRLTSCKAAQAECNFELVFAVLPPRSLKRISTTAMTRFVNTTISLINACESKYALIGDTGHSTQEATKDSDDSDAESTSTSSSSSSSSDSSSEDEKEKHQRKIELVKPIREIESGDSEILEHILSQVQAPTKALQDQMFSAVQVISVALAECYDVTKLPDGFPRPDGIILEEIDVRMAIFVEALARFDRDSSQALEKAADVMADGNGWSEDLMPKMETHLIASFLTNARQAAAEILDMLRYSRNLVEKKEARSNRRRFYFPHISWKKWLTTGGESDAHALPEDARKAARAGRGLQEDRKNHEDESTNNSSANSLRGCKDEESGLASTRRPTTPRREESPRRKGPRISEASTVLWLRGLAADAVELFADSDDLNYALKMGTAVFLLTWPAFVPSWNSWFNGIRGSWASLQLIIVFEVSVGTSFQGFFVRVFGVIFGCVWGFLAYIIGDGNRAVAVVILAIGILPSFYVQLGTPHVKNGIIAITTMSVVTLSTIFQTNGDGPWKIFVLRMVCFLVGGIVALFVELCLFPVRARDRLVESLASSIQQILQMEASVAVAIDSPLGGDIRSHAQNAHFRRAKGKAEQALSAARIFLPVCLVEPRLKGSFRGQSIIYGEMIYVLFQIIERMDNSLYLREAYGNSIVEDLNAEVMAYRRNIAASITITLFAVHEALTTRLPLPQFLPSCRVAQLRYISRVRELLIEKTAATASASAGEPSAATKKTRPKFKRERSSAWLSSHFLRSMTKRGFLAWNAASAGAMEIIEYLEELVDLAKLLVGVNAFRSGMLERPNFHEYVKRIREREAALLAATTSRRTAESAASEPTPPGPRRRLSIALRKRGFSIGGKRELPAFRRRSTAVGAGGSSATVGDAASDPIARVGSGSTASAAKKDESSDIVVVEDDLPMSLQRVRTRRLEERESGRRRASTIDPKGKNVLKHAETWAM